MTEQIGIENIVAEKKHILFYLKMLIFLALIFVRNVFDASISEAVLLVVVVGILATSDRNEIITLSVCCVPLSPAIQHKYVILSAIIIYWWKFKEDISLNGSAMPLIYMMGWELFHAFGYQFSFDEYLRNFAEMIFCTFLMVITNRKFNYEMLYRVFAVCALVMMTIVLLNLLESTNYNFEKIFTGSYRFGKQEIDDNSFNVSYNQNALGFICNLTISGLLQLIILKKQKIIDYLFIVTLMFFGFLTMSRSFLICCAFIFVLFAFARGNGVSAVLKGTVIVLAIVVIVYFIMTKYAPFILEKITDRFMEKDITGGRADLMSFYTKHIFSEYKYMFFGLGMQDILYKVNSIYTEFVGVAHNGIQEVLIVWGFPGLVFFVMYVYNIIKRARTAINKQRLANYIPFLLTVLYVQSGQLVRSGVVMMAFAFIYVSLCVNFEEEKYELAEKNS